jgi:hypothetical protein
MDSEVFSPPPLLACPFSSSRSVSELSLRIFLVVFFSTVNSFLGVSPDGVVVASGHDHG